MNKVSEKTIERISLYRRKLISELTDQDFVLSRGLADISNSTDVQVRRDLMHLGCKGAPRKGYNTKDLLKSIDYFLNPDNNKVIIVEAGNKNRSLIPFIQKRAKFDLIACFDTDSKNISSNNNAIPCFHISEIYTFIAKNKITTGIINCRDEMVSSISNIMILSGIKSIVNYTSHLLNSDNPNVHFEQIDITSYIDKALYFSKQFQE